jgi:hypothetical protein
MTKDAVEVSTSAAMATSFSVGGLLMLKLFSIGYFEKQEAR